MTDTITITYEPGVADYQQDAVFYVGNYYSIATVAKGERKFSILVSGDTRAYVWNDEIDKAGEEEPAGRVWNDGSKWDDFGITTDEDLANAEARIEWVNNSWYEVYDTSGYGNDTTDHDGEVFHLHKDAVAYIVNILNSDA